MEFPPEPLGKSHIDTIRNDPEVIELVPYVRMVDKNMGECRVAFLDTIESDVIGWYFDVSEYSWTIGGQFKRKHDPISLWTERFTGEVIYRKEDAIQAEELYLKIVNKANRLHNEPVIAGPGVRDPGEEFTKDPASCNHNAKAKHAKTEWGQILKICSSCGRPLSISTQKTQIPVSKLLSENVICKDSSLRTVECEQGRIGIVEQGSTGLSAFATDILTFMAKLDVHFATEFDPELYNAALFLENKQVKGVAVWNDRADEIVLRQVYILPEFRGEGASLRLLNSWYEIICDNEQYLAEAPNDAGRGMLAAAGHLATDATSGKCAELAYSFSPDSIHMN